jgi:hypothetical protein
VKLKNRFEITSTPLLYHYHHHQQENIIMIHTDLEAPAEGESSLFQRQKNVIVEAPLLGLRLKGKYQIRAALQTVLFVSLVAGYGAIYLYSTSSSSTHADEKTLLHYDRFLQADDSAELSAPTPAPCSTIDKAEPGWLAAFYGLGVFYMFLAIAVACDEFFVPALEEMSSPRRLNLSMDVAGKSLFD